MDKVKCGGCGIMIGQEFLNKTPHVGQSSTRWDWEENTAPDDKPIPFLRRLKEYLCDTPYRCDECHQEEITHNSLKKKIPLASNRNHVKYT